MSSPSGSSSPSEPSAPVLSEYAAIAMRHWQRFLPARYAQLEDPASFFSTLGEQATNQIADLAQRLAGNDADNLGETSLDKLARLNAAKKQAEEIVLADLVWLEPEPEVLAALDDEEENTETALRWRAESEAQVRLMQEDLAEQQDRAEQEYRENFPEEYAREQERFRQMYPEHATQPGSDPQDS